MNQKGFSLMELMVIIAIIGVLGAITLSPGIGFLQERKTRSDQRKLIGALNGARSKAIKENRAVNIIFDPDADTYTVYYKLDGERWELHDDDEIIYTGELSPATDLVSTGLPDDVFWYWPNGLPDDRDTTSIGLNTPALINLQNSGGEMMPVGIKFSGIPYAL